MKRKSVSFVACVAKRLLGLWSQAGWQRLSLMLCLMTKSATESEASESVSYSIAGNAKMIISRAAKIVTSSFWMTTRSRWQPLLHSPQLFKLQMSFYLCAFSFGYLCGFSLHSSLMQLSLNEAQKINDAMPVCPFYAKKQCNKGNRCHFQHRRTVTDGGEFNIPHASTRKDKDYAERPAQPQTRTRPPAH